MPCLFLSVSACGPRHLVTRPGPLPASRFPQKSTRPKRPVTRAPRLLEPLTAGLYLHEQPDSDQHSHRRVSRCVDVRAFRVRVRVRVRVVRVCACLCVCVAVRMRVRVRVLVCVCAGHWDDPLRRGRALLWHAGMLYMFTVGLRLGRQRMSRVSRLEKPLGTQRGITLNQRGRHGRGTYRLGIPPRT